MDPQQFLTELDSELRIVIGEFLNMASAAVDVAASDESGRVTVTLRPDRTLARVQVGAHWEDEIEAPVLAATIMDVSVLAQTGEAVDGNVKDDSPAEAADVDAVRDAMLREQTAEMMAPVSAADLQQQIDDLPALLDRLDSQLDVAIEKTARLSETNLPQAEADDGDEAQGELVESENRMVSVRLIAGHLADVRIKESWLQGRSGLAVTQCFDQIMDRIAEKTNDMEPR